MSNYKWLIVNAKLLIMNFRIIQNLKFKIQNLILILAFSTTVAFAQDDNNLNGTLTIDKSAKIELGTANRNFEKINNIPPSKPYKPLDYTAQEVELLLPKLDTKVKVAPLKEGSLSKLYGDYVKVGFGNYTSPYLEAFINNKRSEKYTYGTHFKHFSSQNGPVKNSGLSENMGEVYGKYMGENTVLRGSLGYQRNRYNFYGYDHAREPNAGGDSLKQVLSTFTLSVGIENKNKQDKFNYNTDLNYYNFSTYTKAKESEVLWNLKSDYRLDADKKIIVDAGLSVSKRTDSSTINRTLFTIKPALQYNVNDKLTLIGGFNVGYANDTMKNYNKLHVYPRVNAEYKLIDNKLIAFGGLDGEMQKNTLRTLARENPYLNSNVALAHTNKTSDFYAGFKGGLKGGLSYKIKASSANYKYLYFFNNAISDTSKFDVLYDKGNVNVLNLGGELNYEVNNKFRLGLAGAYYKYTMSKLQQAWQRPTLTGSVLATYNLNQKMYFNADFYYIGGLRGENYVSGQVVKLKGIADLNLKIDYLFSKQFSAFIEANNILSQKYQRYLYYNNKGINVLAGLTYSF
jgi:hypothetical protein